jgi:hypothetical protein
MCLWRNGTSPTFPQFLALLLSQIASELDTRGPRAREDPEPIRLQLNIEDAKHRSLKLRDERG